MSKLETNQVDPATGTTLTLGTSGDTVSIPSGVTIANSGTATGFGETNTPNFFVEDDGAQSISHDTLTKLNFATENYDSDSAFASHKFTVPSGKAGKYFLFASWQTATSTDFTSQRIYFYKNGSALGVNMQTDHDHYGSIQISKLENLSVSDYIEVYVYHNAGGSIDTLGTSTFFGYRITE